MISLQLFFAYSSTMNQLLVSVPLTLVEWASILIGGLVIHAVVGTEKWLRRRSVGEKGE